MSLADAYVAEQARLRACLKHGYELGQAGRIYCMLIEDLLHRADKAAMSQDLPTMIAVFEEMKGIKE